MWAHEVQLSRMVVAGHEEVRLVFVGCRVRSSWLCRGCQALEVELVGVPFPVHLRHDVLIVVIPATIREYYMKFIGTGPNRLYIEVYVSLGAPCTQNPR